jgi:hypothetical protein
MTGAGPYALPNRSVFSPARSVTQMILERTSRAGGNGPSSTGARPSTRTVAPSVRPDRPSGVS